MFDASFASGSTPEFVVVAFHEVGAGDHAGDGWFAGERADDGELVDVVTGEEVPGGFEGVGGFERGDVGAHHFADEEERGAFGGEHDGADVGVVEQAEVFVLFVRHHVVGGAGDLAAGDDFGECLAGVGEGGGALGKLVDADAAEGGDADGGAGADAHLGERNRVEAFLHHGAEEDGGGDGGEHDGEHDLVITRELEEEDDAHEGGLNDGGEDGTHADEGVDVGLGVREKVLHGHAEGGAGGGADEECGREDAAGTSGAESEGGGDDLADAEEDED